MLKYCMKNAMQMQKTTSAAPSEANVHDSMLKDDKLEMRICVCLD